MRALPEPYGTEFVQLRTRAADKYSNRVAYDRVLLTIVQAEVWIRLHGSEPRFEGLSSTERETASLLYDLRHDYCTANGLPLPPAPPSASRIAEIEKRAVRMEREAEEAEEVATIAASMPRQLELL